MAYSQHTIENFKKIGNTTGQMFDTLGSKYLKYKNQLNQLDENDFGTGFSTGYNTYNQETIKQVGDTQDISIAENRNNQFNEALANGDVQFFKDNGFIAPDYDDKKASKYLRNYAKRNGNTISLNQKQASDSMARTLLDTKAEKASTDAMTVRDANNNKLFALVDLGDASATVDNIMNASANAYKPFYTDEKDREDRNRRMGIMVNDEDGTFNITGENARSYYAGIFTDTSTNNLAYAMSINPDVSKTATEMLAEVDKYARTGFEKLGYKGAELEKLVSNAKEQFGTKLKAYEELNKQESDDKAFAISRNLPIGNMSTKELATISIEQGGLTLDNKYNIANVANLLATNAKIDDSNFTAIEFADFYNDPDNQQLILNAENQNVFSNSDVPKEDILNPEGYESSDDSELGKIGNWLDSRGYYGAKLETIHMDTLNKLWDKYCKANGINPAEADTELKYRFYSASNQLINSSAFTLSSTDLKSFKDATKDCDSIDEAMNVAQTMRLKGSFRSDREWNQLMDYINNTYQFNSETRTTFNTMMQGIKSSGNYGEEVYENVKGSMEAERNAMRAISSILSDRNLSAQEKEKKIDLLGKKMIADMVTNEDLNAWNIASNKISGVPISETDAEKLESMSRSQLITMYKKKDLDGVFNGESIQDTKEIVALELNNGISSIDDICKLVYKTKYGEDAYAKSEKRKNKDDKEYDYQSAKSVLVETEVVLALNDLYEQDYIDKNFGDNEHEFTVREVGSNNLFYIYPRRDEKGTIIGGIAYQIGEQNRHQVNCWDMDADTYNRVVNGDIKVIVPSNHFLSTQPTIAKTKEEEKQATKVVENITKSDNIIESSDSTEEKVVANRQEVINQGV